MGDDDGRRQVISSSRLGFHEGGILRNGEKDTENTDDQSANFVKSWSILLPICSRRSHSQHAMSVLKKVKAEASSSSASFEDEVKKRDFNLNRFAQLSLTSQHDFDCGDAGGDNNVDDAGKQYYWTLLQNFASSLQRTSSHAQLLQTEIIVGIDIDDKLFQGEHSMSIIRTILPDECNVVFVNIYPKLYGHVCKIWNFLANKANNDFIVLLGDDVELIDVGWQQAIAKKFESISKQEGLPFGAACVAMNDLAFPGFPTFPVMHRWHKEQFGRLLPKQFVNQGADPYLYDLYARFNASDFVLSARMKNTIGGDDDARYLKHQINWRGQILNLSMKQLGDFIGHNKCNGVVLDIVVPSYRVNNTEFLERIVQLRASTRMYVKFWIVVDNPLPSHLADVKTMADRLNEQQLQMSGNYYINVLHYSANRGASYARNFGFNFSTADWVLFLDDDIIPDENLLDAYAGAIRRYPDAKVFVGLTELPTSCNVWTQMLCTCNVGYFYSIAKRMVHPSWGVTANLMVRGSRDNSTIQFKEIYPRTGGGEDIDLVYQFKKWYFDRRGCRVTAAVPEARVVHPWWNHGRPCYRQIMGWAWGDSLCIEEWKQKTFLTCPNWIEMITFIIPALSIHNGNALAGLVSGLSIALVEHAGKARHHYVDAKRETGGGFLSSVFVAFGAGSIISSQEVTRVAALIYRRSWFSLFRRVDWFDGDKDLIKLDVQLTSFFRFVVNTGITWAAFTLIPCRKQNNR
jgi:Glycosyl transferase family 2